MNERIKFFEQRNNQNTSSTENKHKIRKVNFSSSVDKENNDEKHHNIKKYEDNPDIDYLEQEYKKSLRKSKKFIENNFNNDNSYVRKTLKKKHIQDINNRKSKKLNKNKSVEKNNPLKYREFIKNVRIKIRNSKEDIYDISDDERDNDTTTYHNNNDKNDENKDGKKYKMKTNSFCDFLNQFVNKSQSNNNEIYRNPKKVQFKELKHLKTINNKNISNINNRNSNLKHINTINITNNNTYYNRSYNIKNIIKVNDINLFIKSSTNQNKNRNNKNNEEDNNELIELQKNIEVKDNYINQLLNSIQQYNSYIQENEKTMNKLKNELQIKENNIKDLTSNIQKQINIIQENEKLMNDLRKELEIKENKIKELSKINNIGNQYQYNIITTSNKISNITTNNSTNKSKDNKKIAYNVNKPNENNNINSNINKFNNIKDNKNINEEKIIINTSYEPKKEEINNKKSEKEKKASRAFERFKRVNKSADTGVKPGAAKKSDKISGMAKMLENHMGNKENQEDNILNKKENNNQFNEDIINIINDQPIINKKKKKVKSFSFDG